MQDGSGRGRASLYHHVHGNDVGDLAAGGVALAEYAAVAGEIADRDHQLGFRSGVVSALQRDLHVARYRAGDEEQVGVAGAGDEPDAQSFEVVIGVADGVYLQFAAVARTGIDLPDRERATESIQDLLLQTLFDMAYCLVRLRRRFGLDARLDDLFEYLVHLLAPTGPAPSSSG